jgi:diadenosine tetraphosphate (Ap4A) HIT family hydrolase
MNLAFDTNCSYCTGSAKLQTVLVRAFELPASVVYLWRGDRYPGRCVVALKEHERELFALSPSRRSQFMEDVSTVAAAVSQGFKADKVNYAVFGDTVPHLHFHVVPKHKDGLDWGNPFVANPAENTPMSAGALDRCLATLTAQLMPCGAKPLAPAKVLSK